MSMLKGTTKYTEIVARAKDRGPRCGGFSSSIRYLQLWTLDSGLLCIILHGLVLYMYLHTSMYIST